jgi:hypothetical protein
MIKGRCPFFFLPPHRRSRRKGKHIGAIKISVKITQIRIFFKIFSKNFVKTKIMYIFAAVL